MKRKVLSIFMLFSSLVIFLFLISCGSAGPFLVTKTPSLEPNSNADLTLTAASADRTATAVAATTLTPVCPPESWPCPSDSLTLTAARAIDYTATAAAETLTPICDWPCPSDSLTLTVQMGATLRAIPTSTPLPWATILPSASDLGWGAIYGRILDGNTFAPIAGASVSCEQVPASPYPCQGSTVTDADGSYSFTGVFFRETDRIVLNVEAPGYDPLHFEEAVQILPELHADLGLFPLPTQEPILMCTPPACEGGQLTCGSDQGCPGGCGTICVFPTP